ncbi:hypothetical protein FVEG_15682 [Fusarium verticillioides 7600]|uniref:Uncharacterized protein n=1 Tax=Gibberella moniliformis (strain M3125 / FGSC 7600) TaxID=334819 RepID=W7MAI2_GIBM7|nr:hypothetical protein FVEG_15682 [Fusarium verticillioides 7600]EWG44585.1 hypothetical protein FVEG_15682 [Fusarium verticillioides 7600]
MRGIEVLRIRMQVLSCLRVISTYTGKIQERDAAYTRVFLSTLRRLLNIGTYVFVNIIAQFFNMILLLSRQTRDPSFFSALGKNPEDNL